MHLRKKALSEAMATTLRTMKDQFLALGLQLTTSETSKKLILSMKKN